MGRVFGGMLMLLIAVASATPVLAQVYGPDGKELPPVSEAPPTPSPRASSSSVSLFGTRNWRFGVMVGGLVPVGALSDRSAGNIWPSLSLSYEVQRPTASRPYTLTAYAEGMATSRTYRDLGSLDKMNEVREMYGIGLEARGYVGASGPLSAYIGGGVGGYYLRRGIRYDTNDSPFLLFDDHTLISGKYYTQPGFKLLFGLETKNGIFAEFRYLNAGVLESVRYQGFSANIGGRF